MIPRRSSQELKETELEGEAAAKESDSTTVSSPRRRSPGRMLAATFLMVSVVAVFGVLLSIRAHIPRGESVVRIGAMLPALPVVDSSGRVVDAGKAISGRRTIVVFYSPSCEVCHSELPKLQPIPQALGLIMIEVNGGSSGEAGSLGFRPDAIFYDRDRVFERAFSMAALPTILFVDERGVVSAALAGPHQRDAVQKRLSEFARVIP